MVVENPLWGQETEIEEDACSVGYCCFFSEAVLEARRGYIFSCFVVVVRGSLEKKKMMMEPSESQLRGGCVIKLSGF